MSPPWSSPSSATPKRSSSVTYLRQLEDPIAALAPAELGDHVGHERGAPQLESPYLGLARVLARELKELTKRQEAAHEGRLVHLHLLAPSVGVRAAAARRLTKHHTARRRDRGGPRRGPLRLQRLGGGGSTRAPPL